MIDLIALTAEVQNFCTMQGWHSCVIGGIAVQRWGEPRLTRDVDLTLLTGFGNEEQFVEILLKTFQGRIPKAREHALQHRVVLLQSIQGIGIDIALGALPFEVRAITRASDYEFQPGIILRTCSAEDLIIFKAFADRSIDWHDINGILVRQNRELDWRYIFKELTPLCELKEAPEIVERLRKLETVIK